MQNKILSLEKLCCIVFVLLFLNLVWFILLFPYFFSANETGSSRHRKSYQIHLTLIHNVAFQSNSCVLKFSYLKTPFYAIVQVGFNSFPNFYVWVSAQHLEFLPICIPFSNFTSCTVSSNNFCTFYKLVYTFCQCKFAPFGTQLSFAASLRSNVAKLTEKYYEHINGFPIVWYKNQPELMEHFEFSDFSLLESEAWNQSYLFYKLTNILWPFYFININLLFS